MTDPAGKWKTSISDAYGNVIQVNEPNPAGGTFTAYYTYNPANQLTIVSMTRGNVTQTRNFSYTGSDLTSATNPENGTVNYTYDGAHHVLSRTDAIGSITQYTYDTYGRLTLTQYFPAWGPFNGTTEDMNQRVTYSYDSGTNAAGRLTGVSFGGGVMDGYSGDDDAPAHSFTYSYAYSPAGRMLTQTSTVQAANRSAQPLTPAIATFTVGYQWDNEGRMTSMAPSLSMPKSWPNSAGFPTMAYQYDINGRMSGMTADSGSGPQTFATASYTGPGQLNQAPGLLYQLSYGGMTETRTYNSMMQLTNQTVPGYLNMTYNYSTTGANNGRILSSADAVTGENTAYTYDALNRLTNASNSLWSEAYVYDGFGNLTSKTGSGGSPNPAPSMTMTYNANNQQTAGGVTYDANGNLSGVTGYSYGYTVENKMNSQSANAWPWAVTEYAYDPSGKRVMKETNPDPLDRNDAYNPAWEFYFYSITGQKLVTMDCNDPTGITLPSCWVVAENTYFGSKMLVSNGVYIVTDRLGSVRANTQGESFAYYPYGEERTNRPDGRDKFATYFRDAVGQDYAGQRYYGAGMGRFWSPDPGGIKTARASDPTSWNRYAYVGGDPVNRFDPSGSYWCYADGDDDPKTCKMAGFGVMTGYNSSYEETESSGTIQTGDGAVMPGEGTAEPDCSSQFGGSWSLWSGFVTAHYSDTVSLGKAADLPNDWIMAWASVESAWGQGAVTQATGNYFGWASVGDIPCAGGAATFHNDGCFSSFEASAMTALFSTNNRFNYGGYTGISSAAILSDNAYDGAAAAFQALANAGYNTNPVNGPKYGATIGSRVGLIDKAEDCLRTKGEIQ